MTSLPFTQVDAFADAPFTGNPAAVIPLDAWLDDATLQAIAEETTSPKPPSPSPPPMIRRPISRCAGSRPGWR